MPNSQWLHRVTSEHDLVSPRSQDAGGDLAVRVEIPRVTGGGSEPR